MSNYVKTTNFTAKDSLSSGDPNKIIKGAEHDVEYSAIANMSTTKADKLAPVTANSVALLDGGGNLADSGYRFTNLAGAVTCTTAEINKLAGLVTTAVELGYVNGVTSAIQTQLNARLVAANNLSDLVSAATARTNLGLGSLAIQNTINASDIDADAVTAPKLELGVMHGLWHNEDFATVYNDSSWTTQNTFYVYIPAGATTLHHKFKVSAPANGAYFRLTCTGGTGTTTTSTSAVQAWDAEVETLDVTSVAGSFALINVQSYAPGPVSWSHQIFTVSFYVE